MGLPASSITHRPIDCRLSGGGAVLIESHGRSTPFCTIIVGSSQSVHGKHVFNEIVALILHCYTPRSKRTVLSLTCYQLIHMTRLSPAKHTSAMCIRLPQDDVIVVGHDKVAVAQ